MHRIVGTQEEKSVLIDLGIQREEFGTDVMAIKRWENLQKEEAKGLEEQNLRMNFLWYSLSGVSGRKQQLEG